MTRRFTIFAALCLSLLALPALAPPVRADTNLIKQSTAWGRDIVVTAADGSNVTGLASGAFTVRQKKTGGTWVTITPTITEGTLGHYTMTETTAMNDTLGPSVYIITAAGAVQVDVADQVVAFDPNDAAAGVWNYPIKGRAAWQYELLSGLVLWGDATTTQTLSSTANAYKIPGTTSTLLNSSVPLTSGKPTGRTETVGTLGTP